MNKTRSDRRNLGRIELIYVNRCNHVIDLQTKQKAIGSPFDLTANLTSRPNHYHVVRVITGRSVMAFQNRPQRIVIEVSRDINSLKKVNRDSPRFELDRHFPGRVKLIYLDPRARIVKSYTATGRRGTLFRLADYADQLPTGYDFVKVISGRNVKQYRSHEQLINIEVEAKVKDRQLSNLVVQKAFLNYYNAKIMNVTIHSDNESVQIGHLLAGQYITGIDDARRHKTPHSHTECYYRGYQECRRKLTRRDSKPESLVDVLLKMYQDAIRTAAVVHDRLRS